MLEVDARNEGGGYLEWVCLEGGAWVRETLCLGIESAVCLLIVDGGEHTCG